MRIRSIKPEFYRSEDIAALDWNTRLIFIGLWSYVDDNGVGRDVEPLIVADLFPLDDDRRDILARVSRGLRTLSERDLIVRYTVEKRPFLMITTWEKHQRIDKPNKPRYPLPDQGILREADNDSRDTRETLALGTEEQRNRGTEEQGIKTSAPTAREIESAFDAAYSHWPKKVERKEALERFKTASKKRGLDTLAADVTRFGEAYAATTDKQFVPALGVWLNGERWTDELPQRRTQQRAPTRGEENLAFVAQLAAEQTFVQRGIGQ